MTLCSAKCKNGKSCSYKSKKDGLCLIHVKNIKPCEECSICLSSELNNSIKLNCNHIFHANCVTTWFDSGNFSCPVCRQEVSTEILKLYNINYINKYLRDAEMKLFSETFENDIIPERLMKCYAVLSVLMMQEFSLRKSIIDYLTKRVKNPIEYINELNIEINKIENIKDNLPKLLPTKNNTITNCGEYLNNIMTDIDTIISWN